MTSADPHAALLAGLPPETPAVLVVEPEAIKRNYGRFAALAPKSETAAVVKADGYGTGTETAVRALGEAGCRTFFVATLGEARRVRTAAPRAVIYVLDGFPPGTAPVFAEIAARPVLTSYDEAAEWAGHCRASGRRLAAAIQIDTGMHRLGMSEKELTHIAAAPDLLATFDLALVLTQLAVADLPGDPRNAGQKYRFDKLRSLLPPAPWSIAAGGGMLLDPSLHGDVVRPGMPLFGGLPCEDARQIVEPVAFLYARILQVHEAASGECCGYGGQRRFDRPMRLATVSIGFADGYGRSLSDSGADDGAVCHIAGHAAKVVGRVSMDLTIIDVGAVPQDLVRRGDFALMMGDKTTVDDLAAKAGTTPYEILTRIGPRVRRVVS